MKRLAIVAAALVVVAAPAVFAQSSAVTVVQGGPVILEGPATSRPIRGAVIAQAPEVVAPGTVAIAPNTGVLGGPAAVVTTAPAPTVMVNHFWNVPSDIQTRTDFRRWLQLWP